MSTDGVYLSKQMLHDTEMNIGARIKQRLEIIGKDRQWLLAKLPDLSPQALSNLIIRDSKRSEWDEAIADALGVSVLWLVYGKIPTTETSEDVEANGLRHVVSEPIAIYDFSSDTVREVQKIMVRLTPARQDEVLRFAQERQLLQNVGDENSIPRSGQ